MNIYIVISVFVFIAGACFASFASLAAARYQRGTSILFPPSYCDHCGRTLKFFDKIPILSYIFLHGKCRYCGGKISFFSFLCEVFGAFAFLSAYVAFGVAAFAPYKLFFSVLLTVLFIIIAEIDHDSYAVYDLFIYIFLAVAAVFAVADSFVNGTFPVMRIAGAAIGWAVFFAIYYIGRKMTGDDVLGDGDVFLVGISGLLLGAEKLLIAILIGSLAGCAVYLPPYFKNKENGKKIAFAPYLLFGAYTAFVFGDIIISVFYGVIDKL